MPNLAADLLIDARWIMPMTRSGTVLENHTLVVTNGRIAALLPQNDARSRYPGTPGIQRPDHLILPGLVNGHARTARSLPAATTALLENDGRIDDAIRLSIADMLRSGITCFAAAGLFPDETAQAAAEQGIRACIGLPVSDHPTPWARDSTEHLSKALSLRDEYKGHPAIGTAFAPQPSHTLADDTLIRIRTLADELDCGISMTLHESPRALDASLEAFGLRPLERLERLGLLTPALNARHMVHVQALEIDKAQHRGISVTLCPQADLRGGMAPPVAAWTASGIALSLGTGGGACGDNDIWPEARLAALLARPLDDLPAALSPTEALAIATRGGAAALGWSDQIGTLETGKWADLCCIDLDHPALQPMDDVAARLVFCGGRDRVSDVWVAGRHLVAESRLTRLDWAEVSARVQAWAPRLKC